MPLLPRPLRATWGHMKGRFLHRNIVTCAMRAELAGVPITAGTSDYQHSRPSQLRQRRDRSRQVIYPERAGGARLWRGLTPTVPGSE